MGKGLGSSAVPPHAGISCDLRQLCRRYKELDSVRLRDFGHVFTSLGMHKIWYGRQSGAELIEFSERVLQMSVSYLCSKRVSSSDPKLFHQHSLPERIYGVYVCYTFFFLQPQDYVCNIRVTAEEMKEIRDFWEKVLVPKRHLDAAACLYKLIDGDAFKIVPFRLCYDPACHKRYDVPDCDDDIGDEDEEPFSTSTTLTSDPLLKQISLLHQKYEDGKKQIDGFRSYKDVYVELFETVNAVKMEAANEEARKEARLKEDLGWKDKGATENRGNNSKSCIKDKAYTSKIKHSRNRRYVDPEMHKTGDPNEKKSPARKRKSNAAAKVLEAELIDLAEEDDDDEVEVLLETPKQKATPKRTPRNAKKTPAKMNLAMKEKKEKAAQALTPKRKKKGLTPLEILADPKTAAAIENRHSLPPARDKSFQKVLDKYNPVELQDIDEEIGQLLLENASATKKPRASMATPGRKKKN